MTILLRPAWWIIVAAVAVSPITFPVAWATEGFKASNIAGAAVCFLAWPFVAWPYLRAWAAAIRAMFDEPIFPQDSRWSMAVTEWRLSFDPVWRR
jgi:hypothetical protein